MENKELKNLNYKVRASLLLEDQELEFEEIGKSWLKAEKEDKIYFVKTIDIGTKTFYEFSIDREVLNKINENCEIYLGCIEKNSLQKIKICNLTVRSTAEQVQNIYIRLNNDFTIKDSSHFIFDITENSNITVEIDLWVNFEDNQKRIESLASNLRTEQFGTNFKKWYKDEEKKCCYCGVQERDLKTYFHQQNPQYENARQRGRYLEIERIVTAPKEKNIYTQGNTKLACYICNNAKSDFISAKKFKPIAKGIYEFWVEIVGKENIIFPENSNIWNNE